MQDNYINALILYIEKHLSSEVKSNDAASESLAPENIAKRHYVSLSRLYRDFYAYTGHSIKEYIRKRRISNTCEKIKCSDIPFSVIADESGCQTQQAFNKQFRNFVGMTPLEYRRSDTYFYFHPFFINNISIAVKIGAESVPEWTVTRFYDSSPVGIEDKAIAALGNINGRVFGRNGKQLGTRFCYEIMTEKEGENKTATYAVCAVDYNERDIDSAWNYLYNIWLPASMFEYYPNDGEYFEEYLFRNGKPYRLKLYLPVRKRKTAKNIVIADLPETAFVVSKNKGYDAERKASERVTDFLRNTCPILLRNAQKFYVCEQNGEYICGVECGKPFAGLPDGSGLEFLKMPAGYYAVFPDDCLGDISVGKAKLNLWLQNNDITHENEPIFAVYETVNGKYDISDIRMKLYKRLKSDKNG